MNQKVRSAVGKEVWYNKTIGNLTIVDRFTGKVLSFKLEDSFIDLRYKYEMTEGDKARNKLNLGEGYETQTEPEEVFGYNGWKRMRMMEESG